MTAESDRTTVFFFTFTDKSRTTFSNIYNIPLVIECCDIKWLFHNFIIDQQEAVYSDSSEDVNKASGIHHNSRLDTGLSCLDSDLDFKILLCRINRIQQNVVSIK